jgi:hypothetical protein
LAALYYFDSKSLLGHSLFAILAMSVKENLPLLLILNGLRAIHQQRDWRWVAIGIVLPALWFAASLWIISSNRTGLGNILGGHFSYLGGTVSTISSSLFTTPFLILSALFSDPLTKIWSLYVRLVPLLGLPLTSPLIGLSASEIAVQFLIPSPAAYGVASRYSSVIVAVWVYSLVDILSIIYLRWQWLAGQLGCILIAALLLAMPTVISPALYDVDLQFVEAMDRAITIVGPRASISAPANLAQAFAQRPVVLNSEIHSEAEIRATEFVLVDVNRPESAIWLSLRSDSAYEIVLSASRLVLFKRVR